MLVFRKHSEKEGFNPITQENVVVERSAVTVDKDLLQFPSDEREEMEGKLVEGV